MNKTQLRALERIWIAEIDNRLPLQSNAKIFRELEKLGMVQFDEKTVAVDRFGPMKIQGWYLTHLGRYLYCQTCVDEDDEDDQK